MRKQSHDTAQLFGLTDRGVIEVGKKADVNVIDMNALTLHPARMAYDLPRGWSAQGPGPHPATPPRSSTVSSPDATASTPGRGRAALFAGPAERLRSPP